MTSKPCDDEWNQVVPGVWANTRRRLTLSVGRSGDGGYYAIASQHRGQNTGDTERQARCVPMSRTGLIHAVKALRARIPEFSERTFEQRKLGHLVVFYEVFKSGTTNF